MKTAKKRLRAGTVLLALLVCALVLAAAYWMSQQQEEIHQLPTQSPENIGCTLETLPAFSGEPYVVLADNRPEFTEEELTGDAYEYYSPLDELGRCGFAQASVGVELMPTEERGAIGSVKPSGWQTAKYDCVDGKYLYNRCHLIGFQLTGENANKQNLITGTRYMNVDGMLPFENLVADYVKETEHHVLYRVTPCYTGENLVADGVQMEAMSVEDGGEGVCFNVYVYNVQPGVEIDYATGESRLEEGTAASAEGSVSYVLNTGSKKFHLPGCSGAASISEANRQEVTDSRESLIAQGYSPCGSCKP